MAQEQQRQPNQLSSRRETASHPAAQQSSSQMPNQVSASSCVPASICLWLLSFFLKTIVDDRERREKKKQSQSLKGRHGLPSDHGSGQCL
jgi:hypothetical protein